MFQLQLFFLLHCDEWDRVVALPRHKFVTGATLLQLVFSINKTDRHDITEILLKVPLKQTNKYTGRGKPLVFFSLQICYNRLNIQNNHQYMLFFSFFLS